jgi:excisionase family DNA binding protein
MRETNNNLISVREAAQKCGRNSETIRRWVWSGKLPAEKLGNQLFIKESALDSYCRETATAKYSTGSRKKAIVEMRNLRDRIRARIGRDFPEDEIVSTLQKMREDRDYEISGLR